MNATTQAQSHPNQQSRSSHTKTDFDLTHFIDDAISRLGIEDIYTDPSHQFKASGVRHRGGCCFHQSRSGSSFVVTEPSLLFWCEGCQHGGSALDYLYSQKVGRWDKPRGREFIETVKELAALAGMSLPDIERSPEEIEKARKWEARRAILQAVAEYGQEVLWSSRGTDARRYLTEERGFTEDGIRDLGLGLYLSSKEVQQVLTNKGYNFQDAEEACVIWSKLERYILIPWLDSRGRPLTLYGRYQVKTPPQEKPKTIALKGERTKQSPLYLDRALKAGHKEIILVEGVLDAALLQSNGDTRVCAYVAASCSELQIQTLKRHRIESVTLCGDPDNGGENGTLSNLERISKVGIKVYVAPTLPDGLDPDEFFRRDGKASWDQHIASAIHAYTYKAKSIVAQADTSTDKGKAAVLQSAIAFSKTAMSIEEQLSLKTFFWPTIYEALGVDVDEHHPFNEDGSAGNSGDCDGNAEGNDSNEGDGWNPPVSWNGQIGWLKSFYQPKVETDPETGEVTPVLDDDGRPIKEKILKFSARCNFDFQIERELESGLDGGGVVLQLKRVIDGIERQKRVLIKSTD